MARHSSSDRDSLLSNSPPSYRSYDPRPPPYPSIRPPRDNGRYREYGDEVEDNTCKQGLTYGVLGFFGALVLITFILQMTTYAGTSHCPADPLSPIERERVRREWQLERDSYQEERVQRDAMRQQWEREDRRRAQQNQQWEIDRSRHEDEVKGWLDERARMLGQLWNEPWAGGHCMAYNTREYTAELDAFAACKNAPVMIHNKTLTAATCTENRQAPPNRIVGHFMVDYDEPACRPHWGKWYNKGCISWGPRGMRRWESRLWNLRHGDDWQWMCGTTPATVNGIEFSRPTRCENRGIFYGMVGMFEYPDESCGWNSLAATEGEPVEVDEQVQETFQ